MKKVVALMFAASTLLLAGCSTTHEHADAKWEYQWAYDYQTVQSLTAQGWTLDGFVPSDPNGTGAFYILKRRVH
jgi:uncharacterized protein YceK